jgi:hypothetical protein
MSVARGLRFFLVCLLFLWGDRSAWPQTVPAAAVPAQAAPALPEFTGTLRPETLEAREAEIQARMQRLGQLSLPQDTMEALRTTLEQQLKLLSTLRETFSKRAVYLAQLERLPQRLDELHADRQALESQPPAAFQPWTKHCATSMRRNSIASRVRPKRWGNSRPLANYDSPTLPGSSSNWP